MVSEKLAYLVYKKYRQKGGPSIFAMIGCVLFLIILIPVAIFNPGGSGAKDPYDGAWDFMKCSEDYRVSLQDVRVFESYVDPTAYENMSQEEAVLRLNDIYYNVSNDLIGKKTCILKTDEKIIEELKSRYEISEDQIKELLDTLNQTRNGRQYLINPIEEGVLVQEFGDDHDGWVIKGNDHSPVMALANGKITKIETSNESISYQKDMKLGLTLTIEYEVQNGIGDDGEYIMKKMYSRYGLLKDVKLSVGDKVEQGAQLGVTSKNLVYLEVMNEDMDVLDPQYYIYIEKQLYAGLVLPFELPIPITSGVGGRDMGVGDIAGVDFHFGLDMDKGVDTPIKALAEGVVFRSNSTCSPYGGKLGSYCLEMDPVSGGGNYVQIKFEYEDKTYYATYMHMAKVNVKTGDVINAGDVIGTQGHSGNSTASHLHLEIHEGTPKISTKTGLIDPQELLNFDGE